MGNRNSVYPIYDNNLECPICFESINNSILLSCGHAYDYFCIQNHCYRFILINEKPDCPYCRKLIINKDIIDIYKNWSFINYKTNEWIQNNTFDLTKKIIKIKSINRIHFNLFNSDILVPLNKNYHPFFLISPIINNITVFFSDDIIMLSKGFNNNYTTYQENINNYIYGIKGETNDLQWYNFLKMNYMIIKNNLKLSKNIIETMIISDNYIKCYINKPECTTKRQSVYSQLLLTQAAREIHLLIGIDKNGVIAIYLLNQLHALLQAQHK
jgi:hypothetical protein